MNNIKLPSGKWSIDNKHGYKSEHEAVLKDGVFTSITNYEDGSSIMVRSNNDGSTDLNINGHADISIDKRTIKVYK